MRRVEGDREVEKDKEEKEVEVEVNENLLVQQRNNRQRCSEIACNYMLRTSPLPAGTRRRRS